MTLLILHYHTQQCSSCGRTESWSEIYAPQIRGSATVMTPFTGPITPETPVELLRVPNKPVSACFACIPHNNAELGVLARQRWEETRRRKAQEAASPPPSTPKPKAPLRPIEELA